MTSLRRAPSLTARARRKRRDPEGPCTTRPLKGLQAEGKVRFIGMSGILPDLPDHIAMGVFDVFQIPYSAVQRDHEELITQAAGVGTGTFIRGGAARGAAAEDKNWRTGPLSQDPGVGQRNWRPPAWPIC